MELLPITRKAFSLLQANLIVITFAVAFTARVVIIMVNVIRIVVIVIDIVCLLIHIHLKRQMIEVFLRKRRSSLFLKVYV